MRMSRIGVLVVLGASLGAGRYIAPLIRPAQAPLSDESASRIEMLVQQLSAQDWAVRQAAQDELSELGVDAQPRLIRLLVETKDEDVRLRVEAALRQIMDNRTAGPSLITMHLKGAGPAMAFAELSRQANADLRTQPPELWETGDWTTQDIEIDRQPFWQAMRILCEKFPVNPTGSGTGREMVLADARGQPERQRFFRRPHVISGPFLVQVTSITTSRAYADLSQKPLLARPNGSVQMLVYAEPKLRVLQGTYSAMIEEAIDNRGNSVAATANQGGMQAAHNWFWSLHVPIIPAEQSGDRIAHLRGNSRYVVQTRSEVVEIDDVMTARNVSRRAGAKQLTLKEVKRNGDLYVVVLTMPRSAWNPNEWTMGAPGGNLRLIDADGMPLTRTLQGGQNLMGGAGENVDVNLHFQRQNHTGQAAGEPAKLAWEIPVEARDVIVPFHFRDLVLP